MALLVALLGGEALGGQRVGGGGERRELLGHARLPHAEAGDQLGDLIVARLRPGARVRAEIDLGLVPLHPAREAQEMLVADDQPASDRTIGPMVTRTLADDGVLTVVLARPEARNAIDGEMAAALRDAFEAAADDAAVRAVILTGEGSAFSAGGDRSRFERDWDPREFRHDSHRLTQLISLVERLEKPTVAAINGVATGAGTQLALVCDVRLMAAGARFVYREGRLGIIPSHGGVTRLVKLIGLARARDVILGGEEVSALQAHRLGMVTEVVPEERLLDAARERVALMLKRSPQAYAAAKRLLWLAGNVDLESGMVTEGLAQSLLIGTDEHKEARWRR